MSSDATGDARSAYRSRPHKKGKPKHLEDWWCRVYLDVLTAVSAADSCKDQKVARNWATGLADAAIEDYSERFGE